MVESETYDLTLPYSKERVMHLRKLFQKVTCWMKDCLEWAERNGRAVWHVLCSRATACWCCYFCAAKPRILPL